LLGATGIGRDGDDLLAGKNCAKSGSAVMWSTGIVKKPWI
jgi:hypothetical protein